jgi:hypothetical protein
MIVYSQFLCMCMNKLLCEIVICWDVLPRSSLIIRRQISHPFEATDIVTVLNVYGRYVCRTDTGRQITHSHTYTDIP